MTKVVYNILGVNQDGYKEILGFYVAESEGANFWLGVLNDLKQLSIFDSERYTTSSKLSELVTFREVPISKF